MFDIKRILVPVDFAECSKKGLELAFELATKYGAGIEVLHVWLTPPYATPSVSIPLGAIRMEELEELGRQEAENQLLEFIETMKKPSGIGIRTRVIMGVPQEAILAASNDFDLVVMGTHGRRGFAHLFLGSVAEKVIRACKKPVLVVNEHEAWR